MITQETYDALKNARNKLKNWKGDTKKMLFEGQAQDLYDLLDTTIREFEGENEMVNVPDSIFLVIGEDTPDGGDFNELDEVTWSKERVSYKDIEYVRKDEPKVKVNPWHDAKTEEPDLNEHVLFEVVPNAVRNPPVSYRAANAADRGNFKRSGWKPITPMEVIRRWAYIKDLLSKGGER